MRKTLVLFMTALGITFEDNRLRFYFEPYKISIGYPMQIASKLCPILKKEILENLIKEENTIQNNNFGIFLKHFI